MPSLGDFADQAELTQALARLPLTTLKAADASPDSGATVTTAPGNRTELSIPSDPPGEAAVERCDQAIRAVPGQQLGDRSAVAVAVLADRPVLVYSHRVVERDGTATPVTLLSVADVESCRILFAVQR